MSALSSRAYENMIGEDQDNNRNAHLVHFFESDYEVATSVAQYVLTGIQKSEGVIVAATQTHFNGIKKELSRLEVKVEDLIEKKVIVFVNADEILEVLLIDHRPDWLRFQQTIAKLMKEMLSIHPKVRAYGEIVDLLASRDNLEGAIALEALWNELARSNKFNLLCGYSVSNFSKDDEGVDATRVCSCHSHSIASDRIALNLLKSS